MSSQIDYYNRFGNEFKQAILACPEPHLWTTDYEAKGRVYREIKERLQQQEKLIDQYFQKEHPVLDAGCGFGRQAYVLAKKGFTVTGTDSSPVFIQIARELFKKHGLNGTFVCGSGVDGVGNGRFMQVLLLDVLEHIAPGKREAFILDLAQAMEPKGKLILSLPHVKKRLTSQVNNRIRKTITQHLSFFRDLEEHPYPIPQAQEINRLMKKQFHLLYSVSTPLTDYYVFEKTSEMILLQRRDHAIQCHQ